MDAARGLHVNYTTLQAEVASYLHRADLGLAIPTLIEHGRCRIVRDLRSREQEATATLVSPVNQEFALPTDVAELRRVEAGGRLLRPVNPAELVTWSSLALPAVYCVRGGSIAIPGTATASLWYWKAEPKLVTGTTEHPTMAAHPQLWVAAAMLEAALYLADTEQLATWSGVYQGEVDRINAAARRTITAPAPAAINTDAYSTFGEALN